MRLIELLGLFKPLKRSIELTDTPECDTLGGQSAGKLGLHAGLAERLDRLRQPIERLAMVANCKKQLGRLGFQTGGFGFIICRSKLGARVKKESERFSQ